MSKCEAGAHGKDRDLTWNETGGSHCAAQRCPVNLVGDVGGVPGLSAVGRKVHQGSVRCDAKDVEDAEDIQRCWRLQFDEGRGQRTCVGSLETAAGSWSGDVQNWLCGGTSASLKRDSNDCNEATQCERSHSGESCKLLHGDPSQHPLRTEGDEYSATSKASWPSQKSGGSWEEFSLKDQTRPKSRGVEWSDQIRSDEVVLGSLGP